jgi:polyhydroxyalkanoate synthase
MRGYALDHIKAVFPPWEIKSSPSQTIDIKTAFPFSLERYLSGGQVERVLVVPPIINHPWILDMRPEISVIQRFCESGFDVYMIRWNCDHEQDIGFYQMISFIREVLGKIGNTSIFGYCTGGIIALLFTSFYPKWVNSLSLLATPVEFSSPDLRILWGKLFDAGPFRRVFKNIPGQVINAMGMALWYYHLPVFLCHQEFVDEVTSEEVLIDYWRRLRWIVETPSIPGKAYEEFIQGCYRENVLTKNAMTIDDHRISLSKIDVPLLNIMAQYDHIVPIESVRALRKAVASSYYEEIIFPSSHVGLSVGRRAHQELWPTVAHWIKENHLRNRPMRPTGMSDDSSSPST